VASNIWFIWNLKKQRVETARDVKFDETRLYNPLDPFVEDELSVSLPTPPAEIQVLPGQANKEVINTDIELPGYITPNMMQAENADEQSIHEELIEIGEAGVEKSQKEDAANQEHSAEKTTLSTPPPLPTPDKTLTPGNSGSNWMPGTFAEPEEQLEPARQEQEDSPS
jgi:hypothetical protein